MPAKSKKAAKSKKVAKSTKVPQTARGAEKKEEPKKSVNNSQLLPAKEKAVFQTLVRCYETKAYKKGIKAADKVLETYPLHGETLAMKGLVMNCLNKKDEATALVKKGLAMNLKSFVCWHVYGLLYRSEQKYDDAIKCYQNALRIDPDNSQILKDTAMLQIQRRMHAGFQETRRKILMLKTNNSSNWIAYAIGNHLNHNYPKALSVLDTYIKTLNTKLCYENSELFLYKNMVIEESGDVKGALENLNSIEKDCVDKISVRETRAKFNLKLGNFDKALEDYEKLMKINCENYEYHLGLMQAKKIITGQSAPSTYTPEQSQQLDPLYAELATLYPRCAAVARIPLNFLNGDSFKTRLDEYLRKKIRKGVPSLFRDMSSLYKDPAKVKIISEMIESYLKNLSSDKKFSADGEIESPAVYVWALYYAGHHHDYLGQTAEALQATDKALAHTPTNVDLYVLKARIYKHADSHILAHDYMNQARLMDTADRYLNTKCVRYCWRKDAVTEAEETVSLFLRDGDNLNSLTDMQCSWYEIAAGTSWARQKNWGKALKMFLSIIEHFHTIEEDQSDFHSYCLRKMTLRAYVRMMRMEDKIRSHRFFFKAAEGAVQVYLNIYNQANPSTNDSKTEDTVISAVEQKRLDKKAKREQAKAANKAAAEEKSKEAAQIKDKAEEKKEGARGGKKDEDPDGLKLSQTSTPLEDATKLLKDLLLYCQDRLSTHVLAIQVYLHKKKYLLALRSLKKAISMAPNDPSVHQARIEFLTAVEKNKDGLSSWVAAVLDLEKPSLMSSSTLPAINDTFLAAHKNSLPHTVAVCKNKCLLGGSTEEAGQLIVKCPISSSIQECLTASDFLNSISHPGSKEFKARCCTQYPHTSAFFPSENEVKTHFDEHKLAEPLSTCQITNLGVTQ